MDLDELLQTAVAESEKRKQAELRGLKEAEARFAIEDAWIALDASLKDNASTPDLNPFLAALAACPAATQRLRDLQTTAQADYEQSLDTAAGLTAAATDAILANDASAFLRIASLRTSDSWHALRRIGKAVWGEQAKQPEPLKVKTCEEARAALEQMIDRGLPKTSNRELARQLGCSEGLIRKAIRSSKKCEDWLNKQTQEPQPIDSRKVVTLTNRTLDNLTTASQSALPPDEVEHALEEILAAAAPHEAEKIRAMDPASRQDLARTYLEQFADRRRGNRIAGREV